MRVHVLCICRQLETIRNVRSRQQAALHTLTLVRAESQFKSLSNFIRTTVQPAIFWMPKNRDSVQNAVKKTADVLGGELVLLKGKIEKERMEDIRAEELRQKEIDERIAAAREMREERERRAADQGEGAEGDDKEGDYGIHTRSSTFCGLVLRVPPHLVCARACFCALVCV